MVKKIIFLSLFFIITFNSFGQIIRPVRWRWRVEKLTDDQYNLIFNARIQDTWSLYSQHIGEGGPVPTSFTFDEGDHYQLIGDVKESDNVEEMHDKVFDMQIKKFHHKATFTQRIKVLDKSKPVTGYITFMTCDDTRCLPPTDVDFKFDFAKWDRAYESHEPVKKKEQENKIKTNTDNQKQKSVKKENNTTAENPAQSIGNTSGSANKVFDPNNKPEDKSSAQDRKNKIPVKWNFEVQKINDKEMILRYIATMDEGWDVYSMFTEDNGPVPTTVNYEEKDGIELVGKPVEKGHLKEGKDPMFGVVVKKFLWDQPYIIEQKITVKDKTKPLKGYIGYQSCDDERCVFLEKDFAFDLEKGVAIDKTVTTNNNSETGKSNQTLSGVLPDPSSPIAKYNFDITEVNSDCGGATESEKEENKTFWIIFLMGFIGGLLAFLTPCVFPMVPLTVSFFTKRSGTRAKGIRNAIYYGLSIIVIYVLMGLVITGIFGAEALNQLSTNVWFNLIFAVLFIIFGISFFGYFEITLPSSWANKSDKMAGRGGMIGIFFMAFTLALVSFSCTGPIIGTLLVEAARGSGPALFGFIPIGPLAGMFGFSLALALPFALFALFPSWLNSLPKSGSWMNVIKVTLGFIEVALALKFISIADLTMGWKIMPYELFVGLWVIIALAMAAYYFGYLKFPLDPPKQKISLTRKILGVLMLAMAIYFATGFRVSERSGTFVTPNLLSGLAPPPGHSYIHPKHCPLNLNCFHDYDEGLAYAQEQNKPILLDFTGYGCVNCRRMEDNVWSKDEVYKIIKDNYVLISLYTDEKKELENKYYSNMLEKKVRTIGIKWQDFQGTFFNKISQPYYVLLSPDQKILNKPHAYTPDVEEYKAFLECGLKKFNELKSKK